MNRAASSSRPSSPSPQGRATGVPGRVAREGDIRSTTLPNLFHEFSEVRVTGFLHLTDGDIKKSIQFGEGHVLFASSNQRDDRFSQFLLKSGAISLKSLMRALEVMIVTKDRLGEVMVRFKMLTSEDVEKWIRIQVREIVYSIFQWTRGRYSFESRVPSAETIVIGAPADIMLLEAVKRIESWARVYEEVGGLNTEYRATRDMPKITRDLPLSPEEKEILHMCDAPTSLEEICEASKLNDYDVCRTVWALLILGALMKS
ncbi:MAG TPA: DUF4388 domain-containing protein [Candidatus Dormibacteraeota bacterium]|nr:DUF4388 domain-containing protein [Candidatus Dormibacteraeota bacterium]